jgi:hypothetical protein
MYGLPDPFWTAFFERDECVSGNPPTAKLLRPFGHVEHVFRKQRV